MGGMVTDPYHNVHFPLFFNVYSVLQLFTDSECLHLNLHKLVPWLADVNLKMASTIIQIMTIMVVVGFLGSLAMF